MFEQIDVGISLRHAYDMYMESTAETLLEWMADICQCHVGGDPDLTTNIMTQVLKEERHPVSPHHRIAPDLRRLNRPSQRAGKGYQQRVKNRLDWLWHLDTRFWKRPKLLLRQIYSKIATIHPTSREYLSELIEHIVWS
jgi:E3 ubiquitin-protein ligase UBR1